MRTILDAKWFQLLMLVFLVATATMRVEQGEYVGFTLDSAASVGLYIYLLVNDSEEKRE